MKFLLYLSVALIALLQPVLANVVVTSKPIYLIVEPLLRGVDKPKLILHKSHCAHHYHLKTSDAKLLKKAKVVFWSGAELEPVFAKVLADKHNVVLFKGLKGFSWLAPRLVSKQLPIVAKALKALYPRQRAKIDQNLINFEVELRRIHLKTKAKLKKVQHVRLLTTYNFFNVFSAEYNLNLVSFILPSPDSSFSPKNLNSFYGLLHNHEIDIVIKDHHLPLSVLESIVKDADVRVVSLDVEGIDINVKKHDYAILIERIVQSIVQCAG